MSTLIKPMTSEDANNVIKQSQVVEIQSMSTTGFIQSKIGNRIQVSSSGLIQTVSYFDGLILLLTLVTTYTDATQTSFTVERTV